MIPKGKKKNTNEMNKTMATTQISKRIIKENQEKTNKHNGEQK